MLNTSECFEPYDERAAGEVIDGEAIIINLESGVYYSMQGIGGNVWSMIAGRNSVGEMLDRIVAAHEVARAEAERDLDELLRELLAEGLIRASANGANGGATAPQITTKQPYVPPRLQVYRDMQDLLALDPPAPGMNQIAWKR